MQRTSNYQLPQWEKEDRILMEDFNGAMSNIENAIDGVKNQAEGAASAAGEAKTIAERAEGKADAAQGKADQAYCPENKPYVIGMYTGTNATQSIDLGFQPSLLIVGEENGGGSLLGYSKVSLHRDTVASSYKELLKIVKNGFEVYSNEDFKDVFVNRKDWKYTYIAFR